MSGQFQVPDTLPPRKYPPPSLYPGGWMRTGAAVYVWYSEKFQHHFRNMNSSRPECSLKFMVLIRFFDMKQVIYH